MWFYKFFCCPSQQKNVSLNQEPLHEYDVRIWFFSVDQVIRSWSRVYGVCYLKWVSFLSSSLALSRNSAFTFLLLLCIGCYRRFYCFFPTSFIAFKKFNGYPFDEDVDGCAENLNFLSFSDYFFCHIVKSIQKPSCIWIPFLLIFGCFFTVCFVSYATKFLWFELLELYKMISGPRRKKGRGWGEIEKHEHAPFWIENRWGTLLWIIH